jgi:hypothetical protein
VNNGCNTMIAKKIQKSAEKSNAITQLNKTLQRVCEMT